MLLSECEKQHASSFQSGLIFCFSHCNSSRLHSLKACFKWFLLFVCHSHALLIACFQKQWNNPLCRRIKGFLFRGVTVRGNVLLLVNACVAGLDALRPPPQFFFFSNCWFRKDKKVSVWQCVFTAVGLSYMCDKHQQYNMLFQKQIH